MPTLRLDGDARGAVRSLADTTKAGKDLTKTLKDATAAADELGTKGAAGTAKLTKEQREAEKAAQKLRTAAAAIVRDNETPLDRFNRKFHELAVQVRAGNLSVDQAAVALRRYRGELESVSGRQHTAFGARAAGTVVSYFAGLVGPTATIALATRALANYNAELDKVNSGLQGDRAGLGELMQLAVTSGTPEVKAKALVAEAKQIFASGATSSLGEAGHLVFGLESANITDPKQRAIIAQLQNYGVVPDAKGFAPSVASLRSAFPDLSPDKLISMGVVAGVPSPGGADQLIQHAGKSAEQARALGWSPEFALSATSLLSRAYGGASEGGVRLEQMMKQIEHFGFQHDPSLKGMDPFQVLERIAAGGTDQHNLRKYVGGRMEAMQGARTLISNLPELRALTETAGRGGEGLLDQMVGLAQGTPEIDSATQTIGARNRRELSRLGPATTAGLLQAMRDERASGRGWMDTMGIDAQTWFARRFYPDIRQEDLLRSASGSDGYSPELLQAIERHLRSIDDKTKQQSTLPGPTGRQE